MNKTLSAALIIFLLIPGVLALSATPAKTTFWFQPGVKMTGEVTMINDENRNMTIGISFEGPLANYFNTQQQFVNVETNKESAIKYEIMMPSEAPTPGDHEVNVNLIEISKDKGPDSKSVMLATTSISPKVIIRVPYPDQYCEASFYINKEQQTTVFTMPVSNLGSKAVAVHTKLEIFSFQKTKVKEFDSEEVQIGVAQAQKFRFNWQDAVPQGEYQAVLTVYYSDKTITIEKTFDIGSALVNILRVEVLNFHLGDVAKFDIYLFSNWSKTIPNVMTDIQITDKSGNVLTNYKATELPLDPMKITKVNAFWDTNGVQAGLYDMKITLNYFDKLFEDTYSLKVGQTSIEVGNDLTGFAVTNEMPTYLKTTVLIVLVVMLVAINILVILYFTKFRKKT